tara:strand:+ start:903 stop:1193 length:291 start_codon:yes stop_codon:yes gene_type:complete
LWTWQNPHLPPRGLAQFDSNGFLIARTAFLLNKNYRGNYWEIRWAIAGLIAAGGGRFHGEEVEQTLPDALQPFPWRLLLRFLPGFLRSFPVASFVV